MRVVRTIIFLLVCLAMLWFVVLLFTRIFSTSNQTTPTAEDHLSGYARVGTTAQFVIDAPIVLDQEHRTLKISVDSSQSKIELVSGYDGSVVRQDTFPNTVESYGIFLRSLDSLGFTKSKKTSLADERGQCPLQYRFVYRLSDFNRDIYRLWSTSCGTGNFGGQRSSVRTLFQRQIPQKTYDSYYKTLAQRA
ncbi:hypothetical protein JNM87_06300 [Candidatus Saccharibacteria bacterium]|nr:hypothetical protein [Candidatus Saccharibacteria bacterium]